jgi:hypothetical protein
MKMTRILSATFLMFYTAFTVVVVAEHTASAARTFSHDSTSQTKSIQVAAPHSYQARMQEDPFVGFRIATSIALADTGTAAPHLPPADFMADCHRYTPSRAPPAFL